MKHAKKNSLQVHELYASVEDKEILHGVTLQVDSGTIHAIMGPNGSGKSTLVHVLMGHPMYHISNSSSDIFLDNKSILEVSPEDRAKAGIFLGFQSPISVPGVSVMNLLRTSYQQIFPSQAKESTAEIQNPLLQKRWSADGMTIQEFTKKVKEYAAMLHIDELLLQRGIHDGFSGGEKKKIEMLQALVLQPKFAMFDEIDTGLDVDALRLVAHGISQLASRGTGVIIVTHYQRILKYLSPDIVHILVSGKLIKSAGAQLAKEIEEEGYEKYLKREATESI